MRIFVLAAAVALFAGVGFIVHQGDANAQRDFIGASVDGASLDAGVQVAKKCGFDSDCSHGKCKSGKCGACGFDSDCKGWGKCKSGKCGACGFDSDCKGFGKCKSGKCEKSPYE